MVLLPSPTVTDDGLVWDFRLRSGATFHDGSKVTADDVVYSFRRVLALGMAPAGAFLPVLKPEGITATDKLTVRFELSTAYAPFMAAIPGVSIVNPRQVQAHEKDGDWGRSWLASNGAGSGAYRIVSEGYRPLEYLDMIRFEPHFMGWQDNPKPIGRIAWRPTRETSTRVLALLNGSLDCTDTNLPADQVDAINASKIATVREDNVMRTFVVRMNNTRPPVQQPQCAPLLRARVQLHGVHYRNSGWTRHPRSLPDAADALGLPKRCQGL